MTEEQAAKILRQGSKMAWDAEEFCEAYDMGIKALERQSGEDCVSREKVKNKAIQLWNGSGDEDYKFNTLIDYITDLLPVTPTHGTCKDCKHCYMDEDGHGYHCEKFDYTRFPVYADFYCADYEKRGNENESIN